MIADEELIKEIKRGNKSSLNVLVDRYYKVVYAYIYRSIFDKSIAYDLTQETFIKIINNIKNYAHKGSLKSWMLTIAVNQCRDYFRSKEAKTKLLSDSLEESEFEADNATIPSIFERKETRKYIIQKMQELPFEQREVINLKYFHDLKLKEIADVTNTSESTVKSRLYRGMDKLGELLERSDFYDGKDKRNN